VRRCRGWAVLQPPKPGKSSGGSALDFFWPCVIYLRAPLNQDGADFLVSETKLMVIPCGPAEHKNAPLRPYKHGVWVDTRWVFPFLISTTTAVESDRSDRIRVGLESKHRDCFAQGLQELETMTGLADEFELVGTLDVSVQV
jgi:hypothetical protein